MNAAERFLIVSRALDVSAASAELAPAVVMLNPASDGPMVGLDSVAAALRAVDLREIDDSLDLTSTFTVMARPVAALMALGARMPAH